MNRPSHLSLLGLCLLVGGSGVLHFIAPGPYRRIVPVPLRAHAAAVVATSGICELVCAALLAIPRTRRLGATATAGLFVAVFPANIQMAFDSLHADTPVAVAIVAWLRLPLQIPLVLWALRFRRRHDTAAR
ncbi:MAG: DoxX family protein [Thermomicrobiales bacterium]